MTLEELLNKLIEKGWKPMGYEANFVKQQKNGKIHIYSSHGYYSGYRETLRTLTSKESGLWQFCTENGMVEDKGEIRYKADENNDINDANYMGEFYYWLLESSLKDESELEEFLLNNIKIEG